MAIDVDRVDTVDLATEHDVVADAAVERGYEEPLLVPGSLSRPDRNSKRGRNPYKNGQKTTHAPPGVPPSDRP